MSNQTKINNLNYLIDPTFVRVNILFFLSFENKDNRMSFPKYYTPNVELKDFNVLIDGKKFFLTLLLSILFRALQTNCNRFEQVN